MSQFRQPSLSSIREIINQLSKLDLEKADIDFIKTKLSKLLKGYRCSTPYIPVGQRLFRTIIWDEKPINISQLSYPPMDKAINYRRCNRPGKPMFYCSIAPNSTIFELGLKPDQKIVLSEWHTLNNFIVQEIGYDKPILQGLESSRTVDTAWWRANIQNNSIINNPINRLVYSFLSEKFTKNVTNGHEYLYKISIAISERLTEGKLHDHHEYDSFAGIIYPSIAMYANADNLALFPKVVDSSLVLKNARYILIKQINIVNNQVTYDIQDLDFANSFETDGTILWKGRTPNWKLLPGEQLNFFVENNQWIARNIKGETIEAN